MAKPIVAVVGRPNVGKSTLFNKLVGERIAIVEDTPGVTRDRIIADAEWQNHHFTLIDTGGIEAKTNDDILFQMRVQAEIAIDMADLILLLVDGREGMTASDLEVANIIRKHNKSVILVVNKLDSRNLESGMFEFYNLGIGDPLPISAEQGLGLGDLLDEIINKVKKVYDDEEQEDNKLKIAVIGKPNAGKSTLINKLIGEDRLIVSNVPGTTRDAVDTDVRSMWQEPPGMPWIPMCALTERIIPLSIPQDYGGKRKFTMTLSVTALSVPWQQWSGPMWCSFSSMGSKAYRSRIVKLLGLPTIVPSHPSSLSINGMPWKRTIRPWPTWKKVSVTPCPF